MCGRSSVGDDVKATGFDVEGRGGRGQVARNGVGGPVKPQVAMCALHSPRCGCLSFGSSDEKLARNFEFLAMKNLSSGYLPLSLCVVLGFSMTT